MKIAYVCNEYPPRPHGGIGTFVQAIARGMDQRGHQVTVVGLGEAHHEDREGRIRVITLRSSGLPFIGNLISRYRLRKWLAAQAKAGQVDVIEAPDFMGMLPFGASGCPVVIRLNLSSTSIAIQAGRPIAPAISRYERWNLASNPNWIAASQYMLNLTRETFGVSPNSTKVIFNPVPSPPQELPPMPQLPANFVLYAGQISRRKGALLLAEAAREFFVGRPDLHLVYIGGDIPHDGNPPTSTYIREIVGPEFANRVHLLGHLSREHVMACMMRAKVFAFPSRLEALGIVVLEAMSCGLPVVCTSFPPGPEMVTDGVNGLLADPTSAKDFAEKIARLLDDSALARRSADNAKKTISGVFSLQHCVGETEKFYQTLLDSHSDRGSRR